MTGALNNAVDKIIFSWN